MAQRHCQGQIPALRSRGGHRLRGVDRGRAVGAWWRWLPLIVSMIAVLTAAVVKERKIDPKADMQDILWTLAGGGMVWLAILAAIIFG